MISKPHRFHSRNALARVYGVGKTVRAQHIVLKYAPNNRRHQWRAAVVVAKKVHKSAVIRNRIRRRIYAGLGRNLTAAAPSNDMIITVFHESIATMPHQELQDNLLHLLSAAGMLAAKPGRPGSSGHAMIEGKE